MGTGASRSRLHMSPMLSMTDDAAALKLAAAGVTNCSASDGNARTRSGGGSSTCKVNATAAAAPAAPAVVASPRAVGGDAALCGSQLPCAHSAVDVVAGTALRTSKSTVTSSDSPGVDVPIPLRDSDIYRYNKKYNKHYNDNSNSNKDGGGNHADSHDTNATAVAGRGGGDDDAAAAGDAATAAGNAHGEQERRNSSFSRVTYAMLDDIFGPANGDTKYVKLQVIGKGAFGEAYIVERNANYNPAKHARTEAQYTNNSLVHPTKPRMLYAAKVMDLHSMPTRDRHYAQTEIFCLAHTEHFAVIKYYEHYILDSDDETLVIITEFANHGDLYHNLCRGRVVGTDATTQQPIVARLQLLEREAGTYFVQLLLALHHIHSRRMMHRDVKSANLFLTSNGIIKLGDFGFSQKYESTVSSESIAGTFLGTPYYLSPEMWRGMRYGKKADVWAAGMVLYEMLMDGARPFDARTLPELRELVLTSDVVLPECPPPLQPTPPLPDAQQQQQPQQSRDDASTSAAATTLPARAKRGRFSSEMRELVQCIFQRDPSKRPSAEELLHLPIMQHYLCVFEKHVRALCAADDARLAHDAAHVDALTLHFPDAEERALLLRCIDDAKALVARELPRDVGDAAGGASAGAGGLLLLPPRYEGVVYKDNRNNVWKERYLVLADNTLTISLSKGKEAVSGTERSKKVPLKLIKSVSPCEPTSIVVAPSAAAAAASSATTHSSSPRGSGGSPSNNNNTAAAVVTPSSYQPPYAFAIAMDSSNSIVFGVATAEELDCWLTTLMRALQMN